MVCTKNLIGLNLSWTKESRNIHHHVSKFKKWATKGYKGEKKVPILKNPPVVYEMLINRQTYKHTSLFCTSNYSKLSHIQYDLIVHLKVIVRLSCSHKEEVSLTNLKNKTLFVTLESWQTFLVDRFGAVAVRLKRQTIRVDLCRLNKRRRCLQKGFFEWYFFWNEEGGELSCWNTTVAVQMKIHTRLEPHGFSNGCTPLKCITI